MVNMICFNCKGNGFIKLSWEGEQSIEQCKVCKSTGKLNPKNIIIKHGLKVWIIQQMPSIMGRLLTARALKIIKFMIVLSRGAIYIFTYISSCPTFYCK